MVKKLEKYKNHNLAIAIQMNFKAGMKAKAIADDFNNGGHSITIELDRIKSN